MIIVDCIQGTDEWHKARLGIVTASRVHDILPGKNGKYKEASRENYKAELICEILTGNYAESYCSTAMQHGIEMEPIARSVYEAKTGIIMDEVGFIKDENWPIGCSPDCIKFDSHGLEIKCPNTATHLNFLLNKKIKPTYYSQIQTSMAICGVSEWHFVSFDDRVPEHLSFCLVKVKRDNDFIDTIYHELNNFQYQIKDMLNKLEALNVVD